MGVLSILIEHWVDQRAVRRVWRMVAREPELAEIAQPEDSNIYRLDLPNRAEIKIELQDVDKSYRFRRSLFELVGLGERVYLLDPQPGSLFGKDSRLFVLAGWGLRPRFVAQAPAGIEINGDPVPVLDLARMAPMAVHSAELMTALADAIDRAELDTRDKGEAVLAGPLTGPSPEEDVTGDTGGNGDDGGDDPTDTPPPIVVGEEIDKLPPTYLFYGICFQGYSKRDRFGIRSDPLWDQTLAVTQGFARRSYRTRTGLAGSHGPSTPPVDTFNMMMLSLERDIPVTYCNSTGDQLVLFVAAHGYGPNLGAHNHPVTAMKWETVSGRTKEWITHAAFWQRLQQIGAIRRNPQKVRVIVYSCRSGGMFGARPAALSRVGLFTSTQDAKTLCYWSFAACVTTAIRDPRVKTWRQFYAEVARCLRRMGPGNPQPKNG